jgi:hypothetical protein
VGVPADRQRESVSLHRFAGMSAIVLGLSYVAITAMYVVGGALPDDPAERLRHLDANATAWWLILGLSVLTDLLFLPVMWSLFQLLKHVSTAAMLAGTGLVGVFIVLDLTITWPNFAALISLSDQFATAADETQRTVVLGAATYAVDVLSSSLFGVFAILVPAAGIFVISLAMLKRGFGRLAAYTGLATGVFGLVAIVGPIVVDVAGAAAILASVLTTVWILVVGFKLVRVSSP